MSRTPIRIGISRCLLGEAVRFDGGHKRDGFLTDVLSRYVEWVPVCPEVEVGLGTPREPMRLVGDPHAPRLITIKTGADHTETLARFSRRRVRELEALALSGYVFKKDSPSCGTERVRVYNRQGRQIRNGIGLFARAFMEQFPLVPVEEEGRLKAPASREHFLERVFHYRRWQDLLQGPVTRKAVVEFHARHASLVLAHSREHERALGRLVANARRYTPSGLARRYGVLFMDALAVRATARKPLTALDRLFEAAGRLPAIRPNPIPSGLESIGPVSSAPP